MSDVPASYDEYAAGVDEPRFTDWLRERSEPAWTDAVTHPFTRELGAGTLEEDAYATYLVQDYAFLEALVGTFGFAVGQAPGIEAKRPLIEFLETVTSTENDYFQRSFDALDVPESRRDDPARSPTAAALVDLLGRAAREGGYAETLAVLVPAEWIYREWATAVATEYGDSNTEPPSDGADLPFYYAEWIDLHAVPSFVAFVDELRDQLDAVGAECATRRQARVERLFRRTVDLEVDFFDECYEADSGSG
ncbi:transcriptional regulator [Natronococcus amylolyticus DSM 10524]|uniref:Transcriptional regulator n=1 Tax=Natronococcus amylolyticus DSM 10524 TaxID=1227497 RepID=L9X550_9EURY|nr:TenA family protein [Natronococcus amylolyticus]ELY56830.1 transcriptional regulator [Natronococcus amylolyticus DSM 10524]